MIISFGCQQTNGNKKINDSAKPESIKSSVLISEKFDKESGAIEKTAVIYKSIDMGMTLSSFANGIPSDATLSGIKQSDNKIYVSTDYHGIFASTDGQDNWIALNSELIKGYDINCIEIEESNIIIGVLRHGILVSNDKGLSWKKSEKITQSHLSGHLLEQVSRYMLAPIQASSKH